MKDYRKTLLLDSSYMAKGVISSERAFVIYYKGNCEIIDSYPEKFGLVKKDIDILKPAVILVKSYIEVTGDQKVALNRENIYKRDNYECVYCQTSYPIKNLTLDHVLPQSKGGPDTWENLVTACKKCNNMKADLTLLELGVDIPKPSRPHYLMLLKKIEHIPEEWKPYLFIH